MPPIVSEYYKSFSSRVGNMLYPRFVCWLQRVRQRAIPRDIFESFRPLLFVFLLMGIMPYRLVGERGDHRLQPVLFGGLITVVFIFIFVVAYFLTTVGMPPIFLAHMFPNSFSHAVDLFMVTSSLCTVLCMLFVCLRGKNRLCDLLNQLDRVDGKLSLLGVRVEHGRALWHVCRLLVFSWLLYGVYVSFSRSMLLYAQRRTSLSCWVAYFMPHVMVMSFLCKWRTVVQLLRDRFAVLNRVSICGRDWCVDVGLMVQHIQLYIFAVCVLRKRYKFIRYY